MPELDKTYQIGVTATDFFGSVSKEVTVSVFKVASLPDPTPTSEPQIQNPISQILNPNP